MKFTTRSLLSVGGFLPLASGSLGQNVVTDWNTIFHEEQSFRAGRMHLLHRTCITLQSAMDDKCEARLRLGGLS